ncbi:ABA4-like family protein [Plastoroseomonas hellenica]|uniref:ABA4-like family protein n=1 Tax=Plastoroseomonas hellenica TaxID=2687306 RepID=UPI001BAC2AD3|nr:ABA4-like family protein [Plastoroseomonas hellenica]MBR0645010.1 DUF4281 domain-containing protein [Plastoroseomonas hellenica]
MESLFSAAGALAIAGWIALLVAPRSRAANWWLAGLAIPGLLSALYAALFAIHAPGAEGGFSSLAAVAALFRSEGVLLAGWIHYLAFDLFIGAWICRRAAAEGISPWVARLCLPPAFLAGPIGLLLFLALRALLSRKEIRP